jgi:CDP-diacylglycerol---serine O-phosphatidyltransferase
MKSTIPNLLTLSNLLSGCIAIVLIFEHHLEWASIAVLVGMVFDFFDGLVVPGLMIFKLLQMSVTSIPSESSLAEFLPYLGFIITLGAAFRLAKFNVLPSQDDFIGLPTPANAILIVSLPLIMAYQSSDAMNTLILNPAWLIGLAILSVVLMNLPIRIMSMKFSGSNWKELSPQIILVVLSVVFLITLKFAALPLIVFTHILISLVKFYPR